MDGICRCLDVLFGPIGSHGSNCSHMIMIWVQLGHMIMKVMQPWIPVSKQIKMADKVSLSL